MRIDARLHHKLTIQKSIGPFSPAVRAQATDNRIEAIAKDLSIKVDSLRLEDQDQATNTAVFNRMEDTQCYQIV